MTEKAFQDYYPEYLAHCYGCGNMNEVGNQLKSYWDGDGAIAHWQAEPHQSVSGVIEKDAEIEVVGVRGLVLEVRKRELK